MSEIKNVSAKATQGEDLVPTPFVIQATQLAVEDGVLFTTPSELSAIVEQYNLKEAILQEEFNPVITSDFDQMLEQDAAAAGLNAGGQDDVHSFVRLNRVIEETTPLSYKFLGSIPDDLLPFNGAVITVDPIAPVVEPPVVPPEPPVEPPVVPPEPPVVPPEPPVEPLDDDSDDSDDDSDGTENKDHQDNGWGNGDDNPPGNSGDHNNAENNTSGKEDPTQGNNGNDGNSGSNGNAGGNGSDHDDSGNGNNGQDDTGSEDDSGNDDSSDTGSDDSTDDSGNNNEGNQGGPQGNNGWGNGDQQAPGNSLDNNNAENSGGESASVDDYPGNSNHLKVDDVLANDDLLVGGSSISNSHTNNQHVAIDLTLSNSADDITKIIGASNSHGNG